MKKCVLFTLHYRLDIDFRQVDFEEAGYMLEQEENEL